jgi:hypothetical protein
MITIIALMIQVLVSLITPADSASAVVVIPAKPQHAPISNEDQEAYEWSEFYCDAYDEYADQFTALFNSYSYKLSKNGRSMINGKFVKMGI